MRGAMVMTTGGPWATLTLTLAVDVFPSVSVTVTWNVAWPIGRLFTVTTPDSLHAGVWPAMEHENVRPGSSGLTTYWNWTVVPTVAPELGEVMVTCGATALTEKLHSSGTLSSTPLGAIERTSKVWLPSTRSLRV